MLQQGRFVTSIPGVFLIQIKRLEKILIKQMNYIKKCPLMLYLKTLILLKMFYRFLKRHLAQK